MPDPREHPFDGVVDEITKWLDEESQWYADALVGEYRAPFSAPISETEKLGAYRRMFYQHDSEGNPQYDQPNNSGRESLFNRVTPAQYIQIAKAVGPKGGLDHMTSLNSDYEPAEGTTNPSEETPNAEQ